jgi:hypothetical protein
MVQSLFDEVFNPSVAGLPSAAANPGSRYERMPSSLLQGLHQSGAAALHAPCVPPSSSALRILAPLGPGPSIRAAGGRSPAGLPQGGQSPAPRELQPCCAFVNDHVRLDLGLEAVGYLAWLERLASHEPRRGQLAPRVGPWLVHSERGGRRWAVVWVGGRRQPVWPLLGPPWPSRVRGAQAA